MTAKEVCRVEDSLLGKYLKLGARQQCAICGSRIFCKEVITSKSRTQFDPLTFFACTSCFKHLNTTHDNLISSEQFLATLRKLKKFKSITFVDIETTGLLGTPGEIIEIGAVKYDLSSRLKTIGIFFQRIKPATDYFEPEAMAVNGIKFKDLDKSPPAAEVLPKFLEFINHSLVVAHRANFDAAFLNRFFDRHGIKRPNNPVLDTYKIGEKLYGKKLRLDELLKTNRIRIPFSRHKSWIDCLTTSEVFFRMARWYTLPDLDPVPFSSFEPPPVNPNPPPRTPRS